MDNAEMQNMRPVFFASIILFSCVAIALFAPLLMGTQALFWHDVSLAYMPLRTAAAEAISAGHLPLWDARFGNGFPVLAEGQAGVFYPPNWLGYTGLPQYQCYAILVVLHCIFAAIGMALLCGLGGLQLAPCLFAGGVYAFSGFFITHLMHITIIESAAWLPWMLLCFEKWLRKPRLAWLFVAAACLGIQELTAMPQMFFYSVLTLGLYSLIAMFKGDETGKKHPWTLIALVGIIGLASLYAAVQLLPTQSLAELSERAHVTASDLRGMALKPHNIAFYLHPYIFGSYAEGNYFGRDHHYEVCGFVGILTLLLACWGIRRGQGRLWVFALAVIPISLFMALANQNPLYEILPHIPGFNSFRGAGRYVLLTGMGLGILAAWGLQAIINAPQTWRKNGTICAGVSFALCLISPVISVFTPLVASHFNLATAQKITEKLTFIAYTLSVGDNLFFWGVISILVLGVVLVLGAVLRLSAQQVGLVAVAGVMMQLCVFAAPYNPTISPDYYKTAPQTAKSLPAGSNLFMLDQEAVQKAIGGERKWLCGLSPYFETEKEILRPNRQVLYNLSSASIFYALVPARYWVLNKAITDTFLESGTSDKAPAHRVSRPEELLSAMGVGMVFTPYKDSLSAWPVVQDWGGYRMQQNLVFKPIAYFADEIVTVKDEAEALGQVSGVNFKRNQAVIEGYQATGEISGTGEVIQFKDDFGHLQIQCKVEKSPAILVVRQTWDPHFECFIDGKSAPIYRANYLYRAVVVAPGTHSIEMKYNAKDLRRGGLLSASAILLSLLALVWSQRRRKL